MFRLNCLIATLSVFCGGQTTLTAQPDTVLFAPLSEYAYSGTFSAYSARFDRLGRPCIYTANKEYGVVIFDFSDPAHLVPVRTFTVQDFQNLKPTDLRQQGPNLYVSLGDFEGLFPQSAGLAVIDVSNPAQATISGQWSDAAFGKGSAAVLPDGGHAYLGAMEEGVIVLDISDPAKPAYVSHRKLDLNWPVPPGLFSVPHARGLAIRGQDLWVCFDAGGLRRVDVSDKKNPVEAAKYINVALDATAQPAYNTAAVAGDYLFVAVDYCGLDVVHIAKPAQPATAAWENPWKCSNTNWNGSPGHTNQAVTARHDSLLFVSGGDSEVLAYAIDLPAQPRRAGQYATLHDSLVTWGLDANDSLVVLAAVWNPLNTPYIAKKGGIRLLRWEVQNTVRTVENGSAPALILSPNPASGPVSFRLEPADGGRLHWTLSDPLGRVVLEGREDEPAFDVGTLPGGVYFFNVRTTRGVASRVLIKN